MVSDANYLYRVKLLRLLLICLVLYSCVKEIEYTSTQPERKLVLNGLLELNQYISIRLSESHSIVDNDEHWINGAKVTLYEDGQWVEQLTEQDSGRYVSTKYKARAGAIYAVRAEANGFESVYATDTMPDHVAILEADFIRGLTSDEYGDPHLTYTLSFKDPLNQKNYYELLILNSQNKQDQGKYLIKFQVDPAIPDPVLWKDSELDYRPITFVFSDQLMDGQNYQLRTTFYSNSFSGTFKQPIIPEAEWGQSYVVLRHTSWTYYQYRKSWLRHYKNQQIKPEFEDPFYFFKIGLPQPMYSNVKGGYGVFAAWNLDYFKLDE